MDFSEEDWVTIRFGSNRDRAPTIPPELMGILNAHNQYIGVDLEFGGELTTVEGIENPRGAQVRGLIENLFRQSEGTRIKVTAGMQKGFMKVLKSLMAMEMGENKAFGPYLASLLSVSANLTLNFNDVEDILNSPVMQMVD